MTQSVAHWQTQATVKDRANRPLRDLRISVIDRCNFRCPYCMPVEHYGEHHQFLPRSHWLTAGEIRRVASLFVQLGVKKIRLTGGEPLLRRDILEIVESLASLEGVEDIALTTNGTRLAEHAAELKAAGLKRLTVSLDSLDERVFKEMNGGRGDLQTVLLGLEAANRAGFAPLKINAVIERGRNDHTALDLVERFRGTSTIVRFIEYMDVGTVNGWRPEQVVPSIELLARIAARWPVEPRDSNYRGEVAKRYVFKDGQGEIGFISSVSAPFCGDCHRARLSADGTVYTCLFASRGTELRNALRAGASDADLVGLLQNVWRNRDDRYSEIRGRLLEHKNDDGAKKTDRVEMYRMGG
jgi:cyclic pyranopterin phosphate synthase